MPRFFFLVAAILGIVILGGISSFLIPRTVSVGHDIADVETSAASSTPTPLPTLPEAVAPTSAPPVQQAAIVGANDLPPQQPLANPPAVVKGIYLTGWVAGSSERMRGIINLINKTELNAVVVDIKDYSGYVSYAMDVPGVKMSGAENQIRIARPNALIKQLHDNGIYVIGRVTDFQDPVLAKAHPEWALHDTATGGVWKDKNGLAWMDPAAKPVWDYLASIAGDAFTRGFDEVQFDYIRFASDGALGKISYPYWDKKTPRATVIGNYFKFLRTSFPDKKISADLFGLSTVNSDDLGIGQIIQNAYEYFDYVSPMVYPSHYAPGFMGYKNPASYPYQVIHYSMEHALAKLKAMANTNSSPETASGTAVRDASGTSSSVPYSPFNLGYIPPSKLRPWLQDFNLNRVPYTPAMVRLEKNAVYDTLMTGVANPYYAGWLMWDAANNYTAAPFDPK